MILVLESKVNILVPKVVLMCVLTKLIKTTAYILLQLDG